MKIKHLPPEKKGKFDLNNKTAKKIFFLLFFLATFLGGMFFYRSGFASMISLSIRNLPIEDESIPEGYKSVTDTVDSIQEEVDKELSLYQSNGLSTIFLDIPFDTMMQIEEKREEALKIGILQSSDEDYVSAYIRYNDGQSFDIKMRLKGDKLDHLRTDKWSFRVHITEDDGALLGMRRFSLQAPETRNYVHEWGYHQNLIMENILTTRYFFVNVVINGEHKGIYALEESFTEDLLESQGRREGVIIRLDEDLLWNNLARFEDIPTHKVFFFELADGIPNNEITPFRGSHIASNDTLSGELTTAVELLYSFNQGLLSADQVFDEELWGKYYAITDLWAAWHGAYWLNERLYYNPVTGLLEPIAFDGLAVSPSYDKEHLAYPLAEMPFFDTPGVQKAYVETLERIASPEYVEMLKNEFGDEFGVYSSLLMEEYEGKDSQDLSLLQLPWDGLDFRTDIFSRNLKPAHPVRGNYHLVEKDGATFLQLDLVNLMVVPVQINELLLGDNAQPFEEIWCVSKNCQSEIIKDTNKTIMPSGRRNNFIPVSFLIPAKNFDGKDINTESLSLQVNLYGGSVTIDIPLYSNYVPQGIEKGSGAVGGGGKAQNP